MNVYINRMALSTFSYKVSWTSADIYSSELISGKKAKYKMIENALSCMEAGISRLSRFMGRCS